MKTGSDFQVLSVAENGFCFGRGTPSVRECLELGKRIKVINFELRDESAMHVTGDSEEP